MEPTGFARKHRVQMIMEKLGQCDGIIKTCISICPDSRLAKALDELQENVVNVVAKAEMLSNGDEQIQASRKPIKSGRTEMGSDGIEVEISRKADRIADKISNTDDLFKFLDKYDIDMTDMDGNVYVEGDRVITDGDGWTDDCSIPMYVQTVMDNFALKSNGDEQIQSSIQGQERGIQAIMDEYGCTREEAIEIMNEGITSGCHGKAKKDEKKPVESSTDTPDKYFEDFEDEDAYMKDLDERLRAQYADENGLNLNEDIIDEDDYNEWVHRGAAMYSSVNRNHKNVKALYS